MCPHIIIGLQAASDHSLVSSLAHVVARGRVAGDDVGGAIGAGGDAHADVGGVLPDDLGVVAESHVVSRGDGLAAVVGLFRDPGGDGAGVGGRVVAHVQVLALVRDARVGEGALAGNGLGPGLRLGREVGVPDERRGADVAAGAVVGVQGVLLVRGQGARRGGGRGGGGSGGRAGLGASRRRVVGVRRLGDRGDERGGSGRRVGGSACVGGGGGDRGRAGTPSGPRSTEAALKGVAVGAAVVSDAGLDTDQSSGNGQSSSETHFDEKFLCEFVSGTFVKE